MPPVRAAERLHVVEDRAGQLLLRRHGLVSRGSNCNVPTNLSVMLLSKQSPMPPIDPSRPAARMRCPKARWCLWRRDRNEHWSGRVAVRQPGRDPVQMRSVPRARRADGRHRAAYSVSSLFARPAGRPIHRAQRSPSGRLRLQRSHPRRRNSAQPQSRRQRTAHTDTAVDDRGRIVLSETLMYPVPPVRWTLPRSAYRLHDMPCPGTALQVCGCVASAATRG